MTSGVITPLNIGYLRFDLRGSYKLPPGHPYANQMAELPMLCYHLRLPGRSVLVDAAAYEFPPDVADMMLPGPHPPPLIEQLAAIQAEASAVSDVIITHAHFDHINGLTRLAQGGDYVPAFPKARHYLGSGDWKPNEFETLQNDTLLVLQQHGLLRLVEGALDLGDGVEILPASGETPGHQIAHLKTSEVEAYIAGDLYHHRLEFDEPGRNVTWAEPVSMQASKAELAERAAASGA
jgi:glyoxylase-like metal-dependent hydrolase (beta-lactamase superfamily II)